MSLSGMSLYFVLNFCAVYFSVIVAVIYKTGYVSFQILSEEHSEWISCANCLQVCTRRREIVCNWCAMVFHEISRYSCVYSALNVHRVVPRTHYYSNIKII
jgi:hypothetical protein